jgi:hypothetical protein
VREVVGKFLREDGALGTDSLNWNTSRGSDFRCLGHAIHIMENSTPEKCIMSDFSHVEKWLQAKNPLNKSFKDDVTETFDMFADLVGDSKHGKIFKKYKKVSPVEFVYTAAFLFMHKDANSLAQLASGVLEMFDHVRTVHRDVRMNNRVQKSFTTFISEWKSKSGVENVGGSSEPGNKRKRTGRKRNPDDMDVDTDDDDDDDDDYAAPKVKKKSPQKSGKSGAGPSTSTPHSEATKDSPKAGIKREPTQTVLPAQKPDRLAAIRKTKEAIAQKQIIQPQQTAEPGSRAMRSQQAASLSPGQVVSTTSANPQMLPSPAQAFASPSTFPHASPGQSPGLLGWDPNGSLLPPGTGSSSSSADIPLWKQSPYLNQNAFPTNHSMPIPPPTISPIVSSIPRRDREDRERDRERDRDRRASYDDRDRDSRKYEHHRRDSGGYRPRPDDRDGWPSPRWR